jgi:hypothetical protein
MTHLISMTDFVLEQHDKQMYSLDFEEIVFNYAKFLKTPLTINMFVAFGEYDNLLYFPSRDNYSKQKYYNEALSKYYKAKNKIFFNGLWTENISKFKSSVFFFMRAGTIEDLIKYKPELTESALKIIGI